MKKHTLIIILISLVTLTSCVEQKSKVQILCTNDSHSQVEPKDGRGGFVARKMLVDSLRTVYPNTLLLDAGDMMQGTSYFNLYHGRMEIAAYNRIGYDAITLGNHEFDFGLDTLAMFLRLASFPVLVCNYDVSGTVLEGLVKPYEVFERGGMRIGVIGFGISPESLILQTNFGGIKYQNPIERGNYYADSLRNAGVDFIVAVSHLGYSPGRGDDDHLLATQTSNIDLIFGAHTHANRMDTVFFNKLGKPVHYLKTHKAGQEIDRVVIER